MSKSDVKAPRPHKSGGLFISWVAHHGRSAELADGLGFDAVFISESDSRGGLLGRYVRQFMVTRRVIVERQPAVVAVMLPPMPVLLAVLSARIKPTHIIADLHTGFFYDPKWSWATRLELRLLRRALVIVTNAELATICEQGNNRCAVLHDVLEAPEHARQVPAARVPTPTVLCPLSYANDEPVEQLMEAARLTPNIDYVLTGAPPAKVAEVAPNNVRFTGYLDHDSYWQAVQASWGVVALTTRDHTMQRAGYEALICGQGVLTSNFSVLSDFFEDAAVYTEPDAESIANGVRELVDRRVELGEAARVVLSRRRLEQSEAISLLRNHVSSLLGRSAPAFTR